MLHHELQRVQWKDLGLGVGWMGQMKGCAEPYGKEGQIGIWASLIWRLMISQADWGGKTVSVGVMVPRIGWRPCPEHKLSVPLFTYADGRWRLGRGNITWSIRRFEASPSLSLPTLPSLFCFVLFL